MFLPTGEQKKGKRQLENTALNENYYLPKR